MCAASARSASEWKAIPPTISATRNTAFAPSAIHNARRCIDRLTCRCATSGGSAVMAGVLESHVEQHPDVAIAERVVGHSSGTPNLHDPMGPEQSQGVRG